MRSSHGMERTRERTRNTKNMRSSHGIESRRKRAGNTKKRGGGEDLYSRRPEPPKNMWRRTYGVNLERKE
jgi:hypothetical protein